MAGASALMSPLGVDGPGSDPSKISLSSRSSRSCSCLDLLSADLPCVEVEVSDRFVSLRERVGANRDNVDKREADGVRDGVAELGTEADNWARSLGDGDVPVFVLVDCEAPMIPCEKVLALGKERR
jgi:hypothetical protein